MSLFGLFKPVGPKAAAKLLAKADAQFNRNEFNLARITLEDGLQIQDCPEELRDRMQELHARCCIALTTHNLEMARSHLDAGELEAALDFAETACAFGRSETDRKQAEDLAREIRNRLEGGDFFATPDSGGEPEPQLEVDEEGYADLLMENYPSFIREALAGDARLRRVMVALNREDLETAAEVLSLPDSPSVHYFQTLYHTLKGQPQTALPIFRNLLNTHEDLLDKVRIAEFIDLVRLAKAEDDVMDLVDRHPDLEVIAAAARLAFSRDDLDQAMELAEAGMALMNGDNFDPTMLAFTGVLHVHRGEMEPAADLLDSYRNMMAARGMVALPPQYAVPLMTAFEHTGRPDEALEIGLHTVRAFGSAEALSKCHELAETSTREDLRALLQRLPKPESPSN